MRASDQAYQELKQLIVTADLPPGAPLNETELIARLNLGRTPIREALIRLASEDLVTTVPTRGTFVSGISLRQVRDVFEFRRELDAMQIRLIHAKLTDDTLTELDDVLAEQNPARGVEWHLRLDDRFHLALARATQNQYIVEAVERHQDRIKRMHFVARHTPVDLTVLQEQHRQIVDSLWRGDVVAAEGTVRAHVDALRQQVMRAIADSNALDVVEAFG